VSAHEVLVKARNLIADEKDWCQLAYGNGTSGPWCATGAIWHVEAQSGDYSSEARLVLADTVGEPTPTCWNGSHSHAEVLAAFDRAIAQTAPTPDLSFLKDVRVEPERVA
jgi:hypothetical protein